MTEIKNSIASTEAIAALIPNEFENLTVAQPSVPKTGGDMFTVESQVSKVTATSSNLTPILWVPDIVEADHLSMMFQLVQYTDVREEILPGQHYILVKRYTPEYVIKSIAWKVQAAGCHCHVHELKNLPLENLLESGVTAKELTLMILDCALYDVWSDGNDHSQLSLKNACKVAEAAFALLPEPEKSVELGTLRKRCGSDSWEWNKLMGKLEKKFKLEVERRSGVNKFTEEIRTTESEHEQNFNTIEERVREILERGMGKKGEFAALLKLAQQTITPLKDIEAIAKLQREEDEASESRNERKQDISEFLKTENKSLSLTDFFPRELATPLKKWCGWLNIPESVALIAVLTTASTLHPVGTELVIRRKLDFRVPPILYSAIVGESGQKKSPVYRTLIKDPLRVLQNEAKEFYQQQLKQYDRDLADRQKNKEGPEPTKPSLPVYFFTDATGEGIKAQAQECPDKAMFALIDELAGLFNSANQYRGGKGSDKQDMLSYYDGFGQTVLRSSGIKVDVDRIYLSVFGGIQPSVLRDHLKDLKDADGQWARFLFVHQPLAISTLPDEDSGIDLKELLSGCYRRVSLVPQTQYVLSRGAFEVYEPIYNQLEKKRVSDPEPGMRAVYSKMEGCIGRLALNLHVLASAFSGLPPTKEIPMEIMQKAIALADFYIKEIKSIHMDSKADRGELTALQAKLLEYAQAKGSLTPRDAVTKFNAIKSSPVALEFFRELQAMGYGTVDKQKRNWIFIPSEISRAGIDISRNGLKNLPNNDCSDSRNEIKDSRNDSRNGLLGEQSLPNNNSSDSRNERNGSNDFEDFSQNAASKKPTNLGEDFEKSTDSITPLRSLREAPQNETGTETQPRNGERNGLSENITRAEEEIKVGASVASADPSSPSYHWRGKVVENHPTNPDLCFVCYPERRKLERLKEDTITCRRSDLRKL